MHMVKLREHKRTISNYRHQGNV